MSTIAVNVIWLTHTRRATIIVRGAVMNTASPAVCSRAIVRAILYVNFLLLALFVIPTTHRWVDRVFLATRSVHLEDAVGRSMQVWVVASTILATALFSPVVWKNRRAAS